MNDRHDKKEQLMTELEELRQRIDELEAAEVEREPTEEELRKSEERFSKAFNLNPSPMSITKVEDGRFLDVNESFLRVFGFKREEVIGLTPLELNLYVDHNERSKVLDTLAKEKRASQPEIEIRSKSGEVLIMRFAVEQLELGGEECIIATAVDMTAERLAEEALRESEERYRSLFKNNHSVMILIDPESADIVDANPAACSFYGWSQEELTRKKITDINMLTSEQVFQEMERVKAEKRQHFFFPHRLANEEIRDVEVYSGPIRLHGKELLYSIVHDITERKRTEEALRESEERFRELTELLPQTVFELDREGNLTYSNRCGLETFGYNQDDIAKGINALELFIPAESEKVKQNLRKRLAGEEFEDHEYIGLKKDGSNFPVLAYSSPIIRNNKPVGVRGIVLDIAERKRAEQELRESKDLFEKIFETQRDALFILDASVPVRISDCNPAAAEVFGYNRQEMLGRTTNFLHVDESSLRKFQEQLYPAVTEQGFFHLAKFKMKRKNGTVFSTEHTVVGLEDEKGERIGWISVIRDITEREQTDEEKKKLEGQLLQTKKLEAISTLSGGVAQELSNLFQAVHGYVERLMWGKEQDDPRYQELLEITNAAFRGAVLSRRLLAFSGIIESKKHPIDLNQEIKKVHKLLRRTMPETIELELHVANEITIINGDSNQIEQALLALAVNARDAMPGGGKIIIETKRMMLDENFLRTHAGASMGECALITISDSGPGLGQKTLEHVFDPFYSKEGSSEKAGLGLSMVYGIVKNHGGYISCSSEPEVGTTFMIYLPVSEKEVEID